MACDGGPAGESRFGQASPARLRESSPMPDLGSPMPDPSATR